MSSDTYKAFIGNALSTLSVNQLSNIILKISDTNLEEVGRAVLAEKGLIEKQRGMDVIEETHVAKKVVPRMKPTKKAIPPKKRGRKPVAPRAPPMLSQARDAPISRKRRYCVVDLQLDDLEHRDPVRSLLRATGEPNQDYEKISCTAHMLLGLRGRDRQRLLRISNIMDDMVEWTMVKDREALVTSLYQGEIKMFHIRADWAPETMITTRNEMENFVQTHCDRLQDHPMFASAYGRSDTTPQADASPAIEPEITHPPKLEYNTNAPVTLDILHPMYTWPDISKELKFMDSAEQVLRINAIINGFSSAFDHIANQCRPDLFNPKSGIHNLAEIITQMEGLAGNMCDAPPSLLQKIFESPAMDSLRKCMDTVCTALAKYEKMEFTAGLGPGARQVLVGQLWVVDTILMEVYGGEILDWESGITKVIHLM